MKDLPTEASWSTRLVRTRSLRKSPILPADISDGLCSALLEREHLLEDADYRKVAPNDFIVEISPVNYAQRYQAIQAQVIEQWRSRLLETLVTANSRLGRREYRFSGRVQVSLYTADDLTDEQARIRCRHLANAPLPHAPEGMSADRLLEEHGEIQSPSVPISEQSPATQLPTDPDVPIHAWLELIPGGQRWQLPLGKATIGRKTSSWLVLDAPDIQKLRLVSSIHAYIESRPGRCILYDGTPGGRPSVNGTFVNGERVPPEGRLLQHGDQIILAAIDPLNPRTDTPGVAVLRFLQE